MDPEFENRLSRQPMKPIPGGWRNEILAAANRTQAGGEAVRAADGRAGFAPFRGWLAGVLWPHPVAWAGLAAVWLVVIALNFTTRDRTPVLAGRVQPPPQEVRAAVWQQQRMLAELIGPADAHTAGQLRDLLSKPRSERINILRCGEVCGGQIG
jgi:hypothetical protein